MPRRKTAPDSDESFDPETGEVFSKTQLEHAIASADTLAGLSDLRAKLRTFGDYSRQRGMQVRGLNDIAEPKIECECEIGKRLSAIERASGERTDLTSLPTATRFQEALAEGGWERTMAFRWQIMAGWTSLRERKAYYAKQNDTEQDITSADVYRMAKTKKSAAERVELQERGIDEASAAACRLRRLKGNYAERYPFQFTIRSKRDSGAETELAKIEQGFADWMFYGHGLLTPSGRKWIPRWFVVNLEAWRMHWANEKWRATKGAWGRQSNGGDGTHFVWFELTMFPPLPPILVASSHDVPGQAPSRPEPKPVLAALPLFERQE